MKNLDSSLCDIFEIKHFLASSYHPRTNSQFERKTSTLIQCLSEYIDKDKIKLPFKLPGVLMALRNSPSTPSTAYSPFYIVFGVEMNLPFDIHKIPMDNYLTTTSAKRAKKNDSLNMPKSQISISLIKCSSKLTKFLWVFPQT